jgi:hypothetical protein
MPYTQPSARSYTPMHTACRYTKYKHTACLARKPTFTPLHSAIVHTMHKTTTHSCEQAMYCTYLSVWSAQLWKSAAAMCCAPSAPMELSSRLCAHVCVRRMIQHTCVTHDARSHTHSRVYTLMNTCTQTYQIQTRVHASHVSYLHSSAQRNSTCHAQTRLTTTYSYEQAM